MSKYSYLPRKLYELDPSEYFNTFEEYIADRYRNMRSNSEDLHNLRSCIEELKEMSDNEIIYLWERFSQNLRNCASYLYVDAISMREFKEWLDEDDNTRQL